MAKYIVQIINEAPTVTVSEDTITVQEFQYPPFASTTVAGVARYSSSNFSVSAEGEVSLTLADGGTF